MEESEMDISVIVPLYRGSCYLSGIYEMMQANACAARGLQTELVLINDDPEEKIPEFFIADRIFEVQLRNHSKNRGILQSRIEGAAIAKGKYLLFLDQDDEITGNALAVLYRAAGGRDAALSDWYLEIMTEEGICRKKQAYQRNADFLAALLLGENVIGPPGHCLIKREIVMECWKDLSLIHDGADDYYLWLSFLLNGHRFAVCSECLYTHKYNERSFSLQYGKVNLSKREVLSLIMKRYPFSASEKKRILMFLDYQIRREKLLTGKARKYRRYLFYLRHLPLYRYHMYMHRKTYRE